MTVSKSPLLQDTTIITSELAAYTLEISSFDEDFDRTLRQACLVLSLRIVKTFKEYVYEIHWVTGDVLACLPLRYGKSFIHQAWLIVCSKLVKLNTDSWHENTRQTPFLPHISLPPFLTPCSFFFQSPS